MNSEEAIGPIYKTAAFDPMDPQALQLPSLSGLEVLALTTDTPVATEHLALAEDAQTLATPAVPTEEQAWQLVAGGALPLNLKLAYQHGVTLIIELSGTDAANEITLRIQVNDHEWELAGLSGKQEFYKRSWYLPPDWMRQGHNRIAIKLPDNAHAPIRLKSVAVMRFNLQRQEQSFWCWAAVASGIQSFFDPNAVLTQSQIVEACLGNNENKTLELARALTRLGTLVCSHEAVPALGEIRKHLSNGMPVPVRIGWTEIKDGQRKLTKRGHFVVITGVLQSDPRGDDYTMVRVADPANDMAAYWAYGVFKNSYKFTGMLTHFYILKKQGNANPGGQS